MTFAYELFKKKDLVLPRHYPLGTRMGWVWRIPRLPTLRNRCRRSSRCMANHPPSPDVCTNRAILRFQLLVLR